MRSGFTTGACAQAATRAAALTVATGYVPCEKRGGRLGDRETRGSVEITLPNGQATMFLVTMHAEGVCSVIKDAGDDPDVTNGIQLFACVTPRLDGRVFVDGAEGVGRVTLDGLAVKTGRAAINPVPLKHIREEARRVLFRGAEVTISVPMGEEIAVRTFNPKLGIKGGISILGTTGRVEPWSSTAYQESLLQQLDVARAGGVKTPVFVPGAKGERAALKYGFEPIEVVQMGNFTGMMLMAARDRGFTSVVLLGHASKLVKLARGEFNTHSRSSSMPLDVLADCAVAFGWSRRRTKALELLPTTEAVLNRLKTAGAEAVLHEAARRVAAVIRKEFRMNAEVFLTDGRGGIVGRS